MIYSDHMIETCLKEPQWWDLCKVLSFDFSHIYFYYLIILKPRQPLHSPQQLLTTAEPLWWSSRWSRTHWPTRSKPTPGESLSGQPTVGSLQKNSYVKDSWTWDLWTCVRQTHRRSRWMEWFGFGRWFLKKFEICREKWWNKAACFEFFAF